MRHALKDGILLVVFSSMLSSCSRAPRGSTPSVCGLLNAGTNGDEVTIRGLLIGRKGDGYYLSEGPSGDPCPGWRKTILTAPPVLLLAWTSGAFGTSAQVTREDQDSVESFITSPRTEALLRDGEGSLPVNVTGIPMRKSWPMIFRKESGRIRETDSDRKGRI
jgi:hypothetical protein